jgi:hypothetical protein
MNRLALSLMLGLSFLPTAFSAEHLIEDVNRPQDKQKNWIAIPYVFSSDSMGFTMGTVGIWHGYIQPQMTILANVFVGEELEIDQGIGDDQARTKGIMGGVSGFKPGFSDRVFLTTMGAYNYFPNQRIYLDGSNDSEKNLEGGKYETSPLQTKGYSNWFYADFRYVLPWGESAKNPLPVIQLRRGIPINRDDFGGGSPFSTGQTIFGTELFYSKLTMDKFLEDPEMNTNGVRFYLKHDNTDYADNPSRGYSFTAQLSADFGIGNSTQSWNAIELEYSHFIELPNFSWSNQNVIALNAWTAYSPSWDQDKKYSPSLDNHQTPIGEGATLGSWDRLRAYDNNRFQDKAAIYGAAEYRLIPRLNPLADQTWTIIPIDWFQVVLFAEVGRVAPEYDLRDFFSDMKYDVGFSLRALAAKLPVRFEMAFGGEGSSMWFMINQPF